MSAKFTSLDRCWVCCGEHLSRVHQDGFDLSQYSEQDPELSSYTGHKFWLMRCRRCGFIQPEALPTLSGYFDRMYDQQWSKDWIEGEFNSGYKDFIFGNILSNLDRCVKKSERTLLDIGAHVGRFIHLAHAAGWQSEGVELNALTAGYAERKTRRPVHRMNAQTLATNGKRYDAVTMTDVLEHIPNPVHTLGEMRTLLNENGWLAVKVPCGRNQLLKERVRARLRRCASVSVASNMVHVNHFSPRSLKLALRRAGFTNIKLEVGAPELPPANAAAPAKAAGSNALRLGIYYLGNILPGGVHTPLAFNIQAYAQKSTSHLPVDLDKDGRN